MPSTGIQGLTGLQKSKRSIPPIRTPIYPGIKGDMNWPWAKFFDDLSGDSTSSGGSGTPGLQGVTGLPGIQGSQGPAGLNGQPGTDGQPGFQGETGVQGQTGIQGETGIQGITGMQNFIVNGFPAQPSSPTFLWNLVDTNLYVGGITGIGNWVQLF